MADERNHLDNELDDWARSFERSVPPAPARDRLTGGARLRAEQLAADRRTARRLWGYRAAMAVAIMVLLVAGITLSTRIGPFSAQLDPRNAPIQAAGEGPTLINAAWASTAGYVIEFEVLYASWDDYPDVHSPDHPRVKVKTAVDQWLVEHPRIDSAVEGMAPVEVGMSRIPMDKPAPIIYVQVSVMLADGETAKNLAEYIEQRTGLVSQVNPRDIYFNQAYPELSSTPVPVIIDDTKYTFPYDFGVKEAGRILLMFMMPVYYSNERHFGLDKRFGDCAMHKVEQLESGGLKITTVTETLDPELEIPEMFAHASLRFFLDREDITYPWRDPLLELIHELHFVEWSLQVAEGQADPECITDLYTLNIYLVPDEKFDQLEARRRQLIQAGRAVLPDPTEDDRQAIRERAEFLEGLASSAPGAQETADWLEVARKEFDRNRAREIDRLTRMSDEYRSFSELTAVERSHAEILAAQLREATRAWYVANAEEVYETSPEAKLQRSVSMVGEVPVRFEMKIGCNDPQLVEDLVSNLSAVPGLYRPIEPKHSQSTYSKGTPRMISSTGDESMAVPFSPDS